MKDVDDLGTFVKNRLVVYCNEEQVKNVCCFLDGFVAWRVTTALTDSEPSFEPNPEMNIHVAADSTLAFTADDDMECSVTVVKDIAECGVSVFDAYPPVWPPRYVIASISSESKTTISAIFSGNTYPFATKFDASGIAKKKMAVEKDAEEEWFRIVRCVNLEKETEMTSFLSIFQEQVLARSPCIVRIQSFPREDAGYIKLLAALEEIRNVRVQR